MINNKFKIFINSFKKKLFSIPVNIESSDEIDTSGSKLSYVKNKAISNISKVNSDKPQKIFNKVKKNSSESITNSNESKTEFPSEIITDSPSINDNTELIDYLNVNKKRKNINGIYEEITKKDKEKKKKENLVIDKDVSSILI